MEVYTRLFDAKGKPLAGNEVSAMIIDGSSFEEVLANHEIIFFGSGAEKCQGTIHSSNAYFHHGDYLSARNMPDAAFEKFQQGEFVDTAYFEPFYLKEFIATTPKNKVLKNNK
jgi:tRNA threonylcarbamoyladenosine biosynthesis protein TsaB